MHYLNGRPVSVGDIVIGETHNSHGKRMVGVVTEVMPEQGPCSIRLTILTDILTARGEEYERESIRAYFGKEKTYGAIEYREDYGDAKKFILAADCFRMARAVQDFGYWDSPYVC